MLADCSLHCIDVDYSATVGDGDGVEVEVYRFKTTIQPDMAAASLIISHAGILPILNISKLNIVFASCFSFFLFPFSFSISFSFLLLC